MKRKLPEKFFEQNQRAKTRKWKFFNLNQALWGAGNREFRGESPLIASSREDPATLQSQGGNELMKKAGSKALPRRTGIG